MSRGGAQVIAELISRFLELHDHLTAAEAAKLIGVDQSYISRWRSGQRPTRLQEPTRKALVAVVGSADGALRIAEAGDPELKKYVLSTLRMIQRQAQAIVENAAEAQRVLGGELAEPSSPTIEQAEAEAAVYQRLPALPPIAKKKGKRPA